MVDIHNLFLKEKDEKALKSLYELTQDEMCNILIEWKRQLAREFKDDFHSTLGKCYCDMLEYLYDKYKIDKKVRV